MTNKEPVIIDPEAWEEAKILIREIDPLRFAESMRVLAACAPANAIAFRAGFEVGQVCRLVESLKKALMP